MSVLGGKADLVRLPANVGFDPKRSGAKNFNGRGEQFTISAQRSQGPARERLARNGPSAVQTVTPQASIDART